MPNLLDYDASGSVEWSYSIPFSRTITNTLSVSIYRENQDEIALRIIGEGEIWGQYDEGDTAFSIDFVSMIGDVSGALSEARKFASPSFSKSLPGSSSLYPSALDGGSVREYDIPVTSGGSGLGWSEYTASRTITFDSRLPLIPIIGDARGIRDKMPGRIRLVADVYPGGSFDRAAFGSKELNIQIQPELFIQFEEVDINCSSEHYVLFSALEDLADEGDKFASEVEQLSIPSDGSTRGADSLISNIRNRVSELGGETTLRSLFNRDEITLDGLRDEGLRSFTDAREAEDGMEEFRNDLQALVERTNSINRSFAPGGLRQSVGAVGDRRNDVGRFCTDARDELEGQFDIDRIEAALDGLDDLIDELDNVQFMLDSSPPRIDEAEGPEIPDREDVRETVEETADFVRETPEEIPDEIFDRIDDLRDRADEIINTDFIDRNPEDLRDRRQDARDLIDDIESLGRGRPGRGEALGEARSILGDLERVRAARTDSLPCQSRFPDAHDIVSEFESEVEDLTTDATEDDLEVLEDIEEAASSIIDQIDSNECREQYIRRMRRSNRRIDTRVSPIRVADEFIDQSRERRQSMLESLGLSFSRDF